MFKAKSLLILFSFLMAVSAQAIRLKSYPFLQNVKPTEVTIVWATDRPSVAWVEIAPDDGSDFYAEALPQYWDSRDGIKVTDTIHHVTVTGLKPNTRYRYRVYAREVTSHQWWFVTYGGITATDVEGRKPLVFTTADDNASTVRFSMVNDIHEDHARLAKLIDLSNDKSDFYIFAGDMTSSSQSEKAYYKGFLNTAINKFASEKPFYYTRGNHETRGQWASCFHKMFSPAEPHIYYTFRRGPVFFIILDSGEDKPDNNVYYSGIVDYDTYRTQQAEWLKSVVQSEEYRKATYRVVVCHVPPFGGWHGDIEVDRKFVSVLRNADIHPDLMLCGHTHSYEYRPADARTPFPILVNSNTSVVKIEAGKNLECKVIDVEGKQLGEHRCTPRH